LGLTNPNLYLQIGVFTLARHMFDEMPKRIFIHNYWYKLGWL